MNIDKINVIPLASINGLKFKEVESTNIVKFSKI